MPDPTTLLLLTCANCLSANADSVDVANDTCVEAQSDHRQQNISAKPSNCVSPPETIAQTPEIAPITAVSQAGDALQETSVNFSNPMVPGVKTQLRLGNRGKEVLALQEQLKQLNHYSGILDGVYGKLTQSAVSQFQKAQGLKVDGIVGESTQEKLAAVAKQKGIPEPKTVQETDPFITSNPLLEEENSENAPQLKSNNIKLNSLMGWVVVLSVGIGFVAAMKKFGALEQWQLEWQNAVAGMDDIPCELEEEERDRPFDRPVMLQQSSALPKAITWTLIGLALFGITWASIAKIEQVIPAEGQLKPQGTVKELQAPVRGVVKEVHVEDGQRVKAGEPLISFDPKAVEAELESLKTIRTALEAENQFYSTLTSASTSPNAAQAELSRLKLSSEVSLLAQNRTALMAENELLRTQLNGGIGTKLDGDERAWLRVANAESQSRRQIATSNLSQAEQELRKNQAKLTDARARLATDRTILQELASRNQLAVTNAKDSLAIEKKILSRMEPLVTEGAIARVQYDRQLQEVTQRSKGLLDENSQSQIQYDRQQQEVQSRRAEIAQLIAEQRRLQHERDRNRSELNNTTAIGQKDVLDRIAANKKQVAEIDSQLDKIVLENKKRLAEVDSQLSQAELNFKYQELRAPVAGTVFDLKAKNAGFVSEPSQVLLTIVPDDNLIAEVFIPNKDIGFVKEDMKANIRIESFPFSEFGEIEGEVVSVGSDALPPNEVHPFYRFPAKVKLNAQDLKIRERNIPLQSGMAVDVNIKLREDRRVIGLFTELFTKKIESLEKVR
ncbi:HlyD family efflux transporter periplasmic adaptor subunit [Lusitaniella coriacea]|uniref:HlyD family efflux transporter periplasmic adaptor subunit n=1 Tax=Lusitaniella coriacea TaxID=1983105 RepID=UPI003CEFA9EF